MQPTANVTAPRRIVNAWAMYDWANSVYNLVITTTFFPIYFLAVTRSAFGGDSVPFLGRNFNASSLYEYTTAAAYAVIVLLLPVLSSIADSRGSKKAFMRFFCYLGAASCSALFFFSPSSPNLYIGLGAFALAAIGFVGSLVFYNSYLPEIAALEDRDKVSARGFSFGYVGSVLMQAIGFGLVLYFGARGDDWSGPRYTFLLVGLWWFGFAQIPLRRLPQGRAASEHRSSNVFTDGFRELGKVASQVRRMPVLKQYLVSFFFYGMGVQTVMLVATLFGAEVLNLPTTNLIITVVLIQLVAIAGAIGMARLALRWGNLNVLAITVGFWILICLAAYALAGFAERGGNAEWGFYGLAMAVGLVMGGIQAVSRSTYSKLMPATRDTASFFSFYDVTEKVAVVIGTLSFGYIDEQLGMKNSLLVLIVFFALGLVSLLITRKKQQRLLTA